MGAELVGGRAGHQVCPMRWLSTCAVAAVLTTTGCGSGALGVDIDRDLPEQTIPGDPGVHAAGATITGVLPGTSSYDDAVNQAAQSASVKPPHLALRALTLTVVKPAAGDPTPAPCWDFLHSATVSVQSAREGSTLPEAEIARATDPGCGDVLAFEPATGVDLRPYIDEGVHFVVRVDGLVPERDVTFTGHVTLRGAL